MKKEETLIIELCTDAESTIYFSGLEKGVQTTQVTEEEDLLHPQTKAQIVHIIKKYDQVVLWASIPGSETSFESSGISKLKLNKMLDTFLELAGLIRNKGGIVHFIWPTKCRGWDLPIVKKFVEGDALRYR